MPILGNFCHSFYIYERVFKCELLSLVSLYVDQEDISGVRELPAIDYSELESNMHSSVA